MNPLDVIRAFLEYGEKGPVSPDRLAAGFLKAIEALGFSRFACCSHCDPLRPPAGAVILHNYPDDWVRTFSEGKLYEIDPVFRRAESSPLPFLWDEAFRSVPITPAQKRVLAEAARHGLVHGYTVPLCLSWAPGTPRASCSVIQGSDGVEPGGYLAIQVLAPYLYFFASRAQTPSLAATPVKLTSRERECLTLVAQGKSDWTIGRVLGLSETTVHYHIERLKQRSQVATRMQAVVRALMSGEISFREVVRRTDGGTGPPAGAG